MLGFRTAETKKTLLLLASTGEVLLGSGVIGIVLVQEESGGGIYGMDLRLASVACVR